MKQTPQNLSRGSRTAIASTKKPHRRLLYIILAAFLAIVTYLSAASWETEILKKRAVGIWEHQMMEGKGAVWADGVEETQMEPPKLKEFGAYPMDAALNSRSGIVVGYEK